MHKIYLACPYSHTLESVRIQRFEDATRAAALLMRQNYIVFSPITHSHPIAIAHDLPLDFDFWKKFDKSFLEWADQMYILCIAGWSVSYGIEQELKIIKKMNKPVTSIIFNNNKTGLKETK